MYVCMYVCLYVCMYVLYVGRGTKRYQSLRLQGCDQDVDRVGRYPKMLVAFLGGIPNRFRSHRER